MSDHNKYLIILSYKGNSCGDNKYNLNNNCVKYYIWENANECL